MSKIKILVAMSGGVDSSSVASLMLEKNYDVEGVTLDFGKICDGKGIIDAQEVCKQLGIKHHILKCETNFQNKVVDYFINEYINGRTPNPCAKCNREIKFYELLQYKDKIGADFLATGHYAEISNEDGIYYLKKAIDDIKDQSYFLSQLKYEYLQYIKFPLYNIRKKDIKEYAKNKNMDIVANKKESQDICFIKGMDYKDFLRKYCEIKKGDILDIDTNKKLGNHNGIINYTQGQRKGLGISGTKPLYVVEIDAVKNIVYVGDEEKLFKDSFKINNVNILYRNIQFNKEYNFEVKPRYTFDSYKAKIIFNENFTANIELKTKSRNISKGQLCCIYDNNKIVGSGFIE